MIFHFLHQLTTIRYKKTILGKLLILSLILSCNSSPPHDDNNRKAKVNANKVIKASIELSDRYDWMEYSIGLLNHAAKTDPQNSALFKLHIGLNYQNTKQYDKAIFYFQETIKLNSDFAKPHFYLGDIFLRKRMFNESISHLKSAIKIYTDKLNKVIYTNAIDGRGYEMLVRRAEAFGKIGFAGDLMKDKKTALTYTYKAINAYSIIKNPLKEETENLKILKNAINKMLEKYKLYAVLDKDNKMIITPQNPGISPLALKK